ncbi:unnamed protein product, partial [Effrenium voratum]
QLGDLVQVVEKIQGPNLRADRELQRAAVAANWHMLKTLVEETPDISNDREIVFDAVCSNGCSLEFASPALRRDPELVALALQKSRGAALRWADEALRRRRDLVWAAIQEDAANLQYASEDLRGDPEIVAEAVKR